MSSAWIQIIQISNFFRLKLTYGIRYTMRQLVLKSGKIQEARWMYLLLALEQVELFEKVNQSSERVYILKFNSDSRKFFFWMQTLLVRRMLRFQFLCKCLKCWITRLKMRSHQGCRECNVYGRNGLDSLV